MRLGIVPYLNTRPLVYGLEGEIYQATPARLPSLASEEDIILAPVVAAFEDPSWCLLEGVGIGSFGPAETVRLFFNHPEITIQKIKKIALDIESKTSNMLLKTLMHFYYKIPQEKVAYLMEGNDVEAVLRIGDKAWEESATSGNIDLGEIWTDWTTLPFVFACWMTKNRELGKEWKPKLIAQAQQNLEFLKKLAETVPAENRERTLNYWRRLCYELGEKQKEAIQLFQRYWSYLTQQRAQPIQWI